LQKLLCLLRWSDQEVIENEDQRAHKQYKIGFEFIISSITRWNYMERYGTINYEK